MSSSKKKQQQQQSQPQSSSSSQVVHPHPQRKRARKQSQSSQQQQVVVTSVASTVAASAFDPPPHHSHFSAAPPTRSAPSSILRTTAMSTHRIVRQAAMTVMNSTASVSVATASVAASSSSAAATIAVRTSTSTTSVIARPRYQQQRQQQQHFSQQQHVAVSSRPHSSDIRPNSFRQQHQQQHSLQPLHQSQHQSHSRFSSQRPHSNRSQYSQSQHPRFRSYPRTWVRAANLPSSSSSSSASPTHTLVCYNILCGAYIDPAFFPRTPKHLLDDHWRRRTIATMLTGHVHNGRRTHSYPISNASLIALQEVDSYESFWLPIMRAAGYDSLFKARTAAQAVRADGSAIFWKRDEFDLVDQLEIEYSIYPTNDRKDNIGLGVLLRPKSQQSNASSASSTPSPARYLALINTHLLYNPRRGDLKIGQVQILMNSIDAWLNRFVRDEIETEGKSEVPNISILLCGDLNTLPDSTLMQFIVDKELNLNSPSVYTCMPDQILQRSYVDGTELHQHEKRMREEANNMNASTAMMEKKRRREEEQEEEQDEEEEGSDSDMIVDGNNTNAKSLSFSSSSTSIPYPPLLAPSSIPDSIHSFFPFHAHDTSTHIRHELDVRQVYIDTNVLKMRRKLEEMKKRSRSSFNNSSILSYDPLTSLPVRYRPTAHHYRQSAQVDHILFAPHAYRYNPQRWRPDVEGDAPQAVMQLRLNEVGMKGNREAHIEVADEGKDQTNGATSSSSSPPPSLRVLSLLEFPPISAFQPRTIVSRQPKSSSSASASSVTDLTSDSMISSSTSSSSTTIPQPTPPTRKTAVQHDYGLPVPDNPSDHFPLAITFQIL